MASDNSAVSGGLLVVLGILVALGLGIVAYRYMGSASGPDINITVPAPATGQ